MEQNQGQNDMVAQGDPKSQCWIEIAAALIPEHALWHLQVIPDVTSLFWTITPHDLILQGARHVLEDALSVEWKGSAPMGITLVVLLGALVQHREGNWASWDFDQSDPLGRMIAHQ